MSIPSPFFSVIIASYNRANCILDVIDAVLEQTFADFEIIVVDDCSTDDTLALLQRQKDQRLRIYQTEKNSGGPATPRNIGIQHAKGHWLCFCDSDDYFLPNHLALLHGIITSNKLSDGIVSANAFLIHAGVKTTDTYFPVASEQAKQLSFYKLWKANPLIFSSCCISNTHIVPFNTSRSVASVEDYLFLLENVIAGKSHYYTGKPSVYYTMASADSIRNTNSAGHKIYALKWQLLLQYKLWLTRKLPYCLAIISFDFAKYILRRTGIK